MCTSTTVSFLPRRKFIRSGRNQIPRLLCPTESGCPAYTPAEKARSIRDHLLAYGKLALSHLKKPSLVFRHSFLERQTLNARAMAEHETGHPSPDLSHPCGHERSKDERLRPLKFQPKEKIFNLGAGIKNGVFLP